MNMKGLFHPTMRMQNKLRESINWGLTRIELTYTAKSSEAEEELLDGVFPDQAEVDLNRVQRALKNVRGISWQLPLKDLLDHFTKSARGHQLLIVEPTLATLIYCSNSKHSCYTGFKQVA